MNSEINIYINMVGNIIVDHPADMPAIVVLEYLSKAVQVMYKEAVREEAQRVDQIPSEIEKLIKVLMAQNKPEQN